MPMEQGKDSPTEMSLSQKQSQSSGTHVSSSVSVKSDQSKGGVPNFSEKTPSSVKSSVRGGSYVSSSASVKSDQSKGGVPNLSEKKVSPKSLRSGSHVSSSVSVKSDQSKGDVPNFSEKTSPTKSVRSGSHVSSCVSVKSDQSKGGVPNLNEETSLSIKSNKTQKTTVNIGAEFARWQKLKVQKGLKSDVELASFLLNRVQHEKSETNVQKIYLRKKFRENLHWIFQDLENKIITFFKNELERFKKILKKEKTQYSVTDFVEDMCRIKEAALNITLYFLREMKHDKAANTLEDELVFIHLKSNLQKKYQCVFEGVAKQGDSTLLNSIYTDLYITQGCNEQVNTEHEVRQIEVTSRHQESQEIQVECTGLFQPGKDKKIRTVLTKGVAGIGKSVSVQKFVLDWTEGKQNQDISFIFPLPFREMNLKDKEKQSLMDLITQFFPETKGLNLAKRNMYKVLFILDGLDEFRLPLNFDRNETWSDVTSPASLDVLLTNLIKGNLLPSALIWITTRPAAASKIPPDCIDRVTEIRGFNDAQKEEYFRKRFTDENLGNKIIDHVKKSKSLFIMCHIPVFCWISATVLQNILETNDDVKNNQADVASKILQESNTEDTPKTLTQMYTHFLRFQIQQSRRKYDGEYTPDVFWDKDAILSLGKLAFHQLEKNNLIFYDTDLESCGIDVYKASVYSGMCTQIFKEETGITVGTMYCFVHLSIQEFIAALYAHLFLDINSKAVFVQGSIEQENKNETMIDLLKTAVDKALKSDSGHLDLFLRFLLGLSIQSNRRLLRGLLTQQDDNDQSKKEIVQYIKMKFEGNLSPERSINLFYCLNELNDQTLVKDIQTHLSKGSLSSGDLSPAQWSALAFVLLTSEEELEEFDLQKFKKSDECLIRLSAVIKTTKRALLNDCNLTDRSCSALATVLGSETNLKELNMNNNALQDSGVKLLCTGLENVKCELEILRLSDCSITEEGYKALASALRSNPSHLIELDLTGNDPGQSGVKELNDLLQDPNCQLKTVRFLGPAAEEACQYVTGIVGKNPLLLKELNLSNKLKQVNQIAALLQDKHCKLHTLMLCDCGLTEESCLALATVLISNPCLKELDMSNNNLKNSGVKKLQNGLENTKCTLEKLRLSSCSITEKGYKALASALRSNPSHLIELDLTGNDPGPSGVKELNDLLQDPKCQLKTLRFLGPAADEACQYVTGIVGKNPLLLRELSLSKHKLGDTQVNQIAALLQDKHCKLNTLLLNNSGITEEGCHVLATALNSNPSNLTELDLSENKLGNSGMKSILTLFENVKCRLEKLKFNCISLTDEGCAALASALNSNLRELDLCGNMLGNSGVTEISSLLRHSQCTLQILRLSDCSITEEGYKALASALRSNPSHLIELDLTGNDPGQSGVKELNDLLQDPNCQLKTLRFLGPAADEACQDVTGIVGENPLLLRELNLREKNLRDKHMVQISALLQDKHCKLNTLTLNNNSITAEGCAALTSAFISNPSNLMDLDLSGNKLQNTGIEKICPLLENAQCRLEKLKLSDCSITEEGYQTLTSSLKSNSHLTELDLRGNDPGQSGVEGLIDLQRGGGCKLRTIRFLKHPAAQEACEYLTEVLGVNPLVLKELDLSEDKLGELNGEKLSALLKDTHSKLEKIKMNNCELTEKSLILATVLSSKTILKEMDLNNSRLLDSGVKEICEGLSNPVCELKILKLSNCSITEEGYKALASALRSNPSHLIELDLTGNDPGQSGVKQLIDVQKDQLINCQLKTLRFLGPAADETCQYVAGIVSKNPLLLRELNLSKHELGDTNVKRLTALLQDKHCKLNTLMLRDCGLTEESCSALAAVLTSNPCLKELDMSNNNLQDSGVKKLQNGLKNKKSKLEKLRLSNCSITEEGYKALASALRSNPSHLIELDLTENDPGQSGVKELSDLLQDPNCQLKTLRFLGPAADEACQYVTGIVGKNPLLLRELNLSERELGDAQVNQITALLQDKHCKLNTLKLNNNSITEKGCADLTSAFISNPSNLTELDLSGNKLENSGIQKLCHLVEHKQWRLEKLKLSDCSITEEGYKALASALRSNPSHLIELDLTGNDPGQSGVKELNDLLQDPKCQLKLRFLSPVADEACQYVTRIVGKNPLLLRELNLSRCELGDTRVNPIAALLQDKHCTLNTLILNNSNISEGGCHVLAGALHANPSNLTELNLSGTKLTNSGIKIFSTLFENEQCRLKKLKLNSTCITEKSCAVLVSAFNSNPSNLIELDLSGNQLGDSGVTKISSLIRNSQCLLQILRLSNCSIAEEGYQTLASALRSNPSHLIELDLTGNDPGQSGVKELNDVLQNPKCQLKLRFLGPDADEACKYLNQVLRIKNLLLLRELKLSKCELGDTRVNQIAALLEDKHCKLNTLMLKNNRITEEGCAALISAFNSNPSNLTELNLSKNKLGNIGVKKICLLLKNPQCKLEKLKLSGCSITEEGYKALASALRSNPSHLIELDLSGNDPGQSGVKELIDLLQDECYKFTIRFLESPAAEEACNYLTKVLHISPLLLTELDLSGDKLGDLDGEKLSALLMDSHCKLEKIKLNNCKQTEKICSVLATVLSSKTILKEMDLNDSCLQDSGVKKICEGLKKPVCELKILKLSNCGITENGYKALASALKSYPSHLIELDLRGNDPGQSGVKQLNELLQDQYNSLKLRLLQSPDAEEACKYLNDVFHIKNPLLQRELNLSEHKLDDTQVKQITALLQDKHCNINTLKLRDCGLTEKSCSALATVLISNPCLKELDMSNNNLQNSGVTKLQNGLENTNCKLEKLKLSNCSITEEGYKALASALGSNPSHLIELDLTGNDPGQSGVKQLADLQNKNYRLKLRFLSAAAETACQYVPGIVGSNPLSLRELDLSGRKLDIKLVNCLAALLEDKHCQFNKLQLSNNRITEEGCAALTSAFNSNPSNLIELDLSGNELGNSGIKNICSLLENKQCRLEKLNLCGCSITEKQCPILTIALCSNLSHLRELNLSGNQIKNKGMKHLSEMLTDIRCKLERLRLRGCEMTGDGCSAVTSALNSSPSHLRKLDLSENKLGDSGFESLGVLLRNPQCKLETLHLSKCSIEEKQCDFLTSALKSNPSHLRELDLSGNELKYSKLRHFNDVLKDSHCKLERLRFRSCQLTDEGCSALTSALKSNPSHLRELDLSENQLGQSGVTNLCDLLMKPQCKLEKLNLCGCGITEKQYLILTSALKSNPSHLRVLDLSGNQLGVSVENLGLLLSNPQCKLKKLHLCGCSITEKQCSILTQSLCLNLSHLRELDLSGNQIENKGLSVVCDILKDSRCKLKKLSLNDCGITDVAALAESLTGTKALQFLKVLDLSKNNIKYSKNHLNDVLQDSNCNLILEKEHLYISAGVSYFKGWFKVQEEPVKSTEQESSDEESSE
ncbi:hypothetical protein QQF64_019448, partial [Cirrhinus molitorella]